MISSQALCGNLCLLLVLVAAFAHVGAASTAAASNNSNKMKRALPGSCLMAASSLCANADTNAMRCLAKLAISGDARVPNACAEAIMTGVTVNPRRKAARRATRLSRLLTEASGNCDTDNNCPSNFGGGVYYCNDGNNGCGDCAQGTYAVPTNAQSVAVVSTSASNPNGINCGNICCKADNFNAACCISATNTFLGTTATVVYCLGSSHANCNSSNVPP